MRTVHYFEEVDFYSNSEKNEDFSQFLSDDETLEGLSLLDSLLGDALSGENLNPSVPGLVDDLDISEEEPEVIDRNLLDDEDGGISTGASRSASTETETSTDTKKVFDMSSIEKYLQYIDEEEHGVSVDGIPDFATKKNVYGTSFNVRTGNISRPPQFEFARRDDRWIDSCKVMTYDKGKTLNELLTLGKVLPTVKIGMKVNNKTCKFTDLHCRSAQEMAEMETHHIQEIIRNAFNSRRLAVILFGVDINGKITGCHLNAGKQDNLRLALDTAVQTEFVPPIENILDAIDVQFVPVEDVKDTFLIVILVKNYAIFSDVENIENNSAANALNSTNAPEETTPVRHNTTGIHREPPPPNVVQIEPNNDPVAPDPPPPAPPLPNIDPNQIPDHTSLMTQCIPYTVNILLIIVSFFKNLEATARLTIGFMTCSLFLFGFLSCWNDSKQKTRRIIFSKRIFCFGSYLELMNSSSPSSIWFNLWTGVNYIPVVLTNCFSTYLEFNIVPTVTFIDFINYLGIFSTVATLLALIVPAYRNQNKKNI